MLLNKNIIFRIILILVLTLIFGLLISLNAYADTYQQWQNYPNSPVTTELYQYQFIYEKTSTNRAYLICVDLEPSYNSNNSELNLETSSNTSRYYKDIGSSEWTPSSSTNTEWENFGDNDSYYYELKEINFELYDHDGNIWFNNTSYDKYIIKPGSSFSFETSFSLVDLDWNMDFDIESGTQTGSMTFYKDNEYEFADFNLMISTLSSSVINYGTITTEFNENGIYTLVNNTGYTLSYTDDNPAIEVLSLNSGYYLTAIGTTVMLDMTSETESYNLTAVPNNGGLMKLSYAKTDSDGYTVNKIADSAAIFTLEPGYKYYLMWNNDGYISNDYVRFTSPVVPTEPDLWLDQIDSGGIINWLSNEWDEWIIGDDENYFDILNKSEDYSPYGTPEFNAVLEMQNAEFIVKHYKFNSSTSEYDYYKTYTLKNREEFNLYYWGLIPNVDKLEFYLQNGQANLKISKLPTIGEDYELNMSYKSIGLYETIQEAINDSENIETTEGDNIIIEYQNETGDSTPTTEEVTQWLYDKTIPDYNTDYQYPVYNEDTGLTEALSQIEQSLNIVTNMVMMLFSNPLTGIFTTAFGITVAISIVKFIRG